MAETELLFQDCLNLWRPPPTRSISQWAEESVEIVGRQRPSGFQLSNSPWVEAPLKALDRGIPRTLDPLLEKLLKWFTENPTFRLALPQSSPIIAGTDGPPPKGQTGGSVR
jgi:hypothetical protein